MPPLNDPLKISAILCNRRGGAWGLTIAPGKRGPSAYGGQHDRDLETDVDIVETWGAHAVLTLMESHELRTFEIEGLGRAMIDRFLEWHHHPIVDGDVPGKDFEREWPRVSASLRALVARGGKVLVHCRGGLGRAGMVVARLLVEDGMAPEHAIGMVRAARGSGAIETRAQEAWVAAGKAQPTVLHEPSARDRAIGSLVGLAVGDAVGTTLEFMPKPPRMCIYGMIGGGPFRLRAGQWTDDTAMAMALADSLEADPALDPRDLMDRFVDWHQNGTYSCTGKCFDIGNATVAALRRYQASGDPIAGSTDPHSAGNGSIMRLAPVAVRHWNDRAELLRVADLQGRTTHAAEEAREAVATLAEILAEAIAGRSLTELVTGRLSERVKGYAPGQPRSAIKGSGYVVASLHAALWAVSTTTSFETAILAAANLGEDADTTAAIAGQIAGAVYGLSGIPDDWLEHLAWRERIEATAGRLFDASDLAAAA